MTAGPRVLVVGGGITGLTAAWEAVRGGATVTLLEAGPRIGGKVRTERVDGLLIEHGPDSFVAYRPAALALIEELGLGGDVIGVQGRREVHLRVDGRLRPIPAGMGMVLPTRLGPFAATRVLTWPQKVRAGLDLLLPRRLGPDDTSIGAFLRARLGDGVVERFAEPLVGGIYGAGVDRLSLDAVLPSLRDSEREHRSLMLASLAQGRAARRRAGAAPASPFRTLTGGLGSLVEALADGARSLGADLRTDSAVVSLARSDGHTTARLADGSAHEFDAVVLAVGAAPMAELLAAHAPVAAEALRGIPQASSTVVTLALPVAGFRTPPTSQGWLEVGHAPISGVTLSSTKWAGRAPAGTVLLRAFVPDRLGPLARRPDDEVLAAVLGHVSAVLGFAGEPLLTRVSRWTDVMPTYTVGHLDRVAAVASALVGLPDWQVAGAALHGVGIPECIADGRRAAQQVLGISSAAAAQL